MRILVCGGRDFGAIPRGCPRDQFEQFSRKARLERFMLTETLDVLNSDRHISLVIHGAYRGADALASAWAHRRYILELPFPADWAGRGKAAGPERNQRMIDVGKPNLVVAFPGGEGTADMISRAHTARIEIMEVVIKP